MADQGRLDELKRKFEENPRRYFAPLANEYRKAGEPELAIELCRTYLPQQPTHMSGYIVYGQALHDAGRADESAAVFKQALTLDPENIIALRHLGDIARDSGDQVGALRWYGKVLELDPRNEEIASYMAALAEPSIRRGASGPERQAPPTIRPEPEPDESAVRLEDIVSQPDSEQTPILSEVSPVVSSVVSTVVEVDVAWEQEFHETAGSTPEHADDASPVVDAPFEVTRWPTALDTSDSRDDETADESNVIEGPWHAITEPAEPASDRDATADSADAETHEGVSHAPEWPEMEEPAAVNSGDPRSAGEPPETMSPFVTETMAELYTQQGLHGEALAIYRKLALRRNDPRLHARIAELEGADTAAAEGAVAHAETVGEFFRRIGNAHSHEHVQLAADKPSSLSALFGGIAPDSADVDAAARLSGAFGFPRPGSTNS
ncbi:MAG: tetratricopeptide repeat protein [Gemmatimonadota bacterium]|nr:tetratricopeptide repeat protein [Gemmatimonadota bacterium]